MRSPESTLNPNPFAYNPGMESAPASSFQPANNPFGPQYGGNPFQPNQFPQQSFNSGQFASPGYGDNPFRPQTNEQPFQGFGQEQQWNSVEAAVDTRPPLSERLKQKIDTVIGIGGRAVRSLMDRADGNKFAAQATGHADQLRQQYSGVSQVYDRMQQTASTTWNNPQFQQVTNYAGGMAKETAFAGARGALDHLGEQTGVSYDRENGLSVKKTKLARFAAKAFFAPHATAANTLRGAATAGVGAAKQEGWNQFSAARQDAKSTAIGYAQNAVGWR